MECRQTDGPKISLGERKERLLEQQIRSRGQDLCGAEPREIQKMQGRSMQQRMKEICLISLCLIFVSCMGGDSAFKVRGTVVGANGTIVDNCLLELYLSKTGQLVDKATVGNNFEESFVIAPTIDEYYMVIRCNGQSYQTAVYELGDIEHFNTPIDLGMITLKR